MKIYDVSQEIFEGMAAWPGDQPFKRRWTARLDENGPYNLSAITLSSHSGTHLDAPFHILNAGEEIMRLTLDLFIGPARVIAVDSKGVIRPRDLERMNWNGIERILFKTRQTSQPGDRFDPEFASIDGDAAALIAGRGIRLVGIDSPSIDAFGSSELVAHKILLAHGIPVLEGLRLGNIPEGDYELICLPLKFAGGDGSPVRAILRK